MKDNMILWIIQIQLDLTYRTFFTGVDKICVRTIRAGKSSGWTQQNQIDIGSVCVQRYEGENVDLAAQK